MKRFTVRYEYEGKPVITTVCNILEVNHLISGDAKNSSIETKISENMPDYLHNLIAKHNVGFKD